MNVDSKNIEMEVYSSNVPHQNNTSYTGQATGADSSKGIWQTIKDCVCNFVKNTVAKCEALYTRFQAWNTARKEAKADLTTKSIEMVDISAPSPVATTAAKISKTLKRNEAIKILIEAINNLNKQEGAALVKANLVAILDIKDRNGSTALHFAAVAGHVEIVKVLVEAKTGAFHHTGANINAKNDQGQTPLLLACGGDCEAFTVDKTKHITVVKYLLSKDANPHIADNQGITPLHVAEFAGNTRIIQELRGHDATLGTVMDHWNRTPDDLSNLRGKLPKLSMKDLEKLHQKPIPPTHFRFSRSGRRCFKTT